MRSLLSRRLTHIATIALDRRAATSIEYGLIAVLVAVSMIGGLTQLGSSTTDLWNDLASRVMTAR